MKRIVLIAGARPNFMKIGPLHAALTARGISCTLVHTGQHYDPLLSDVFFRDLEIPNPDVHLGIGSGDRITQTQKIINGLIPVLAEQKPDAILVVGDVTSTAAGAMAGVIAGVPVVHVEAGLRSFNWKMPEELNRMIADHHSSLLFVTEPTAVENLGREGILAERIHLVGNVMIDSLRKAEDLAEKSTILNQLGVQKNSYAVLTLHRPENVDDPSMLRTMFAAIEGAADLVPIIFPVHPRTRARLEAAGIKLHPNIRAVEPLGYLDMVRLVKNSKCVLTDSGGLQEETTALGVPCLTLREETERPITVSEGTSEIVGRDPELIRSSVERVLHGKWKQGRIPDLWDGHAAERIADILARA